jgi:hypothetical protein
MPKIDREKHEMLKAAIISILTGQDLTHTELFEALNKELKGKFEGNISWYAEGVKLDLEAHKVIERIPAKPLTKYHLV